VCSDSWYDSERLFEQDQLQVTGVEMAVEMMVMMMMMMMMMITVEWSKK
jgi:hypothetical protein